MPVSKKIALPDQAPKPIAMNSFNGAESPATRARRSAPSNALNRTPRELLGFHFRIHLTRPLGFPDHVRNQLHPVVERALETAPDRGTVIGELAREIPE